MIRLSRLAPALLCALLGLACKSDNMPADAYAPPRGSMEREVAELPSEGELSDWWTHPFDPDLLLLKLTNNNGHALLTVDARSGSVSTWCNAANAPFEGPIAVGWRNDWGLWDLVDDRLLFSADTWEHPYATVACGPSGQPEITPREGDVWPQTAVPVEGGVLTWIRGQEHPIVRRYAGEDEAVAWSHGAPFHVAKDRFAEALMVVVLESGVPVLYRIPRDTLVAEQVAQIDLGGETFTPGAGASVRTAHADAFVVITDSGTTLATSGAVDGTHVVPGDYSGGELLPYPDGTGFHIHGWGVSMNLENGAVAQQGHVGFGGYHLEIGGTDLVNATLSISANHGDRRVSDGPISTWDVDLSTHWDWLDVQADATFEGFAWENGVCSANRWGSWWGMEGKSIPSDEGEHAWSAADSVLYLGPCEGRGQIAMRELWIDGLSFYYHGTPSLKSDFPVFGATEGVALYDGFDSLADGADRFETWSHGWGMDSRGEIHALWEDADLVLVPRRGTTMWTLKGRSLYRIEADRLAR